MRVTLTSRVEIFRYGILGHGHRTLMFVSLMPSGKSIGSTMTLIAARMVRWAGRHSKPVEADSLARMSGDLCRWEAEVRIVNLPRYRLVVQREIPVGRGGSPAWPQQRLISAGSFACWRPLMVCQMATAKGRTVPSIRYFV